MINDSYMVYNKRISTIEKKKNRKGKQGKRESQELAWCIIP